MGTRPTVSASMGWSSATGRRADGWPSSIGGRSGRPRKGSSSRAGRTCRPGCLAKPCDRSPMPDAFDARLAAADLTLFAAIPSQSSAADRRSWLAVQRAVRRSPGGYAYLEIGSHLGGSLQPHLLDPLCRRIYSIDKRPAVQADDRGGTYHYAGNSTDRMLANLRRVDPAGLDKLV